MPYWFNALLFAVLIVTIPYTMLLRIMSRLPKANALSHRKWPNGVNMVLIGLVTGYGTIFIRSTYYVRANTPAATLAQFAIAAIAYGFGLTLLLRQYSGVYPEYLVTTGTAGLGIHKVAYTNIEALEEIWRGRGETQLKIQTVYGTSLFFTLPTKSVPILHERIAAAQPPEETL